MERGKIICELLAFHKKCFDNHMRTITVLLEQTEKMMELFLQETPNLSEEERKAVSEWIAVCRKGRKELVEKATESYKKVKDAFLAPK